ncbi:unnamed protein product [Rotaria sp. Silwood2]|nr:unnamed protein product [Rotaria sp. Silwood2]CAF2942287.1 unnamed protein product [Rotaria sp. Silwood2]CAF3228310.1 unnamed protein product [Rotaria sp. Silwood2]CAF3366272.1 unnamed protein product [Rotaria sp. Silwood2]CAF4102232.1 unnamed protein product [Rotaria sp. Silwood2]
MLLIIITTDIGRNFLIELFNNEETLTYIRQFTQFINKLNYFKLQHDQWTYYYHLGMTKEGLFCGRDERQTRYALVPCGDLFCSCCLPVHTYKKSQLSPIVDFTSSSMHRFFNGYTTYLNCPATCTTSNVVYAMTCPCGHYDYVDSTAKTLVNAMAYHRQHGNRIIHEKLTGSPLFRGSLLDPTEQE